MVLALPVMLFQVLALPQSLSTPANRNTAAIVKAPTIEKTVQADPAAAQELNSRTELLAAEPALRLATFLLPRPGAEMFLVPGDETRPVPRGRDALPPTPLPSGASSIFVPPASNGEAPGAPLPAVRASPLLMPGRANKEAWYALIAAGHTAATFDAWTTRRVLSRGLGRELNPVMRPFAGNDGFYAAMQVGPGLLDILGRRMMRSERVWVRKIWWLPQVAGVAGSLFSSVHNLHVYNRRAPSPAH